MAENDHTRKNVVEEHIGEGSAPVGKTGRVRAHDVGSTRGDYEAASDRGDYTGIPGGSLPSTGPLSAADDPDPTGRSAAGSIRSTTRHTEGRSELSGATGPAGEKPEPSVVDSSGWTGDPDAAQVQPTEALGLFAGRAELERAMEALESNGFDRAQLSLIRDDGAGTTEAAGEFASAQSERAEPMKRDEEGNLTGILAGIPTYAGAVIAAGVTVATGGTAAIAALAAAGGALGGAALGAGASAALSQAVQAEYDRHLERGGIALAVSLREAIEGERAVALMAPFAIRTDLR